RSFASRRRPRANRRQMGLPADHSVRGPHHLCRRRQGVHHRTVARSKRTGMGRWDLTLWVMERRARAWAQPVPDPAVRHVRHARAVEPQRPTTMNHRRRSKTTKSACRLGQGGQVLIMLLVFLLPVTVITFSIYNVGVVVAEKMKLQNAAD